MLSGNRVPTIWAPILVEKGVVRINYIRLLEIVVRQMGICISELAQIEHFWNRQTIFCDLGLKNVRSVRYFGLATTILPKYMKTVLLPQSHPERVKS